MKVIALSDLHGNLPLIDEDFDLMVICGDICPVFSHDYFFQASWIRYDFINWVNKLNFKDDDSRVILVAGNHDFFFESNGKNTYLMYEILTKATNGRLIYLHNSDYQYNHIDNDGNIINYNIFGTPYCKLFGNWAFMRSNEFLSEAYSKIPYNLDILISHDTPKIGRVGVINKGLYTFEDAGNKILADEILKKAPKYVFCGHIHSGEHNLTKVENINLYNVSLVNENYNLSYKPLILNI